jgi:alpha-galactosidase
MYILLLIITALFAISVINTYAPPPGIKQISVSPPMGWNSWTCFGVDINESKILGIVDAMKSLKLDEYGYKYIIIDDGWMNMGRKDGKLTHDTVKFPNGMKYIGDYIHARGLKFGLYTSVGKYTCEGYPGSYGYEMVDSQTFADWGVDYVKLDWCTYKRLWHPFWNYKERYHIWSESITKQNRDMLIAFCNWGFNKPYMWKLSHTNRITFDVSPSELNIHRIAIEGKKLYKFSGPNNWNDLDSLEAGNGISQEVAKYQFYWWCMLRSPLILGNDIRSMTREDFDIVTNIELIKINQDNNII